MKIGVCTGKLDMGLGLEKCYETISKAGFTAIDWDIYRGVNLRKPGYEGTYIFEQDLDAVIAHYDEELSWIRKNGLAISQAHTPFPVYLPGHPETVDYCIGVFQRMIEFCDYIGCPNLIVHGICLSLTDFTDSAEDIRRLNLHLLESLIPTLQKYNVTICLENLYVRNDMNFMEGSCSDAGEAIGLIDHLNEKAGRELFGLCLDTGHFNLLGKDFRTYVPALGKRIKALHINDNDGFSDQHLAPLAGKVNWKLFCEALRDIGYDGDLCFETVGQSMLALNFDEALVLPWLSLISKTGESFRDRILK